MYKASAEVLKAYAVSIASTHTSGAIEQSRTYFYHPYNVKVVQCTGTYVTGLIMIRNTLKNLLEHLGKDTRNI